MKQLLIKQLWQDYIFHKQTITELAKHYHADERVIRRLLTQYHPPAKRHHPRPVHLVVDATYFGERIEGTSWCVLVARDADSHEDIAWLYADTETTSNYLTLRDQIESTGYTILSVTGDGFSGLKKAFFGIPFQMCHVHMERLVIKGTTKQPQTDEGQALLALVRTVHQQTNSHVFRTRLKKYFELCHTVLNEKSINPKTGQWDWTHRPLRQAALSLQTHEPYLFTFEHDKQIPKTTNSIEGRFAHLKRYLGDHRGVQRVQAEKILSSLLLASSVSPDDGVLNEIL